MCSWEYLAPGSALLAACLAVPAVQAQPQDSPAEATRRMLIHDAEVASQHGEHAQAVSLAARAAQVRMTPSLRMFLAEEHAAARDWLRAYVTATECLGEVRADPSVPHRRNILASCERVERDASPHVGWVVLRVPPDAQGLVVRVAGVELQPALFGVRYPVAAGAVAITARDASGGHVEVEAHVAEGQSQEVSVPAPPRVAWLVLRAPPSVRGLEVRAAGAAVPETAFGQRFPVPPGPVAITARDASGAHFETDVNLVAGQAREVDITMSPRVAWLTLRVPSDAQGLVVRVAGEPVPASSLGQRLQVTPGAVAVAARDARGRHFETEVRVADGQSQDVSIELSPAPTPPPPSVRRWVGPVVLGASGAVVLGLAGVFAGLRADARDARDAADANFDMTAAADQHAQFQTFTTLTNVSLGVGAAGVAGGVLWLVLSRGGSSPRQGMTVAPTIAWANHGAALSLRGVW